MDDRDYSLATPAPHLMSLGPFPCPAQLPQTEYARRLQDRLETAHSFARGQLLSTGAVFHWRELEGWMSLDLQAVFHWRELEGLMSLDLQAVFHWRELEGWMSLDLQAVFHWRELEGWMSLDLQAVFHWRELEGWMQCRRSHNAHYTLRVLRVLRAPPKKKKKKKEILVYFWF
ncbi:unnamed protein product [Gadus morhua 'NCC']